MIRCSASRRVLLMFALVIPILLAGCSDDANPTDPGDGPPSNTPPIPTVPNPNDALPATSDMLAVEDALLGNFTPKVLGTSPLVSTLNAEALALEFRLANDHCRLVKDGVPCTIEDLQWSTFGWENWSDCVPDTMTPCFVFLDSREGSHYYGLDHEAYWMVQDLNCRLAGGDLVCIGSADENAFVHGLRAAWRPNQYLALGFYDWGRTNNDFAWRSGEPVDFTSWSGGEPNNDDGEYFAMMATTGGVWNDYGGTDEIFGMLETDVLLEDPAKSTVPVLVLGESPLFLGDLGNLEERPYIVRSVYWSKVFHVTLGAGATYGEDHTYTHGTSETNGMSFGWSIGVDVSAGWGPVSVDISTELHQDFDHEVTVSTENSVTRWYECTAPQDQTTIFALWQLRERYTICDADGDPWADSRFELDGALPYLDQGLDQEYLQTIYFDQ